MMAIIDPKVEKPMREMLGHAIRGELQELAVMIQAVGDATYKQILGLCLTAAAYVAVDVSGRWPTDADVRDIAHRVASKEAMYELGEEDVHAYLSRAALGFEPLDQAMGGVESAATFPVLITASLLLRFYPRGMEWYEYLDQIWNAYEAVGSLDTSALPALQVRSRMLKAIEERGNAT
jgi:hypothetical protein